ncbi:MAG: 4Fe-4S dicluster domain-containing protein [Planctomycetes bacterium]|nr:4Fe-4S dicluster domain-containing protein [Planctomycetota bacterium]
MITKVFGKTGKNVSAVGFGGMQFDTKQSKEKNAELLLYAFEKGINYFDTAPRYCRDHSEDIFGIGLKQMARDREKWYVSTKGMPDENATGAATRASVEGQLKRLNVEKIDFYYVWCIRKMDHYRMAMQVGGQYEELRRCQEEGLIDHIVLSTHLRGDQICGILAEQKVEGVLMGINILNFPYRWEGVQAAHRMGYGVVAMNPLAGGLIPRHEKELAFLGNEGESPTEAALRFCISCPEITITLNGFTTREHIDMACRAAERSEPYGEADLERIKAHLSENMNKLCTGCGYCLKDCPVQIPISAYMMYYNEKLIAGKGDGLMMRAMKEYLEWGTLVEREATAADCTACGACEEACTQHLNVIERLAEMAEWERKVTKKG